MSLPILYVILCVPSCVLLSAAYGVMNDDDICKDRSTSSSNVDGILRTLLLRSDTVTDSCPGQSTQ